MRITYVTIIRNLEEDGFQAKVVLYLYGVVASLRGTDFVNGDVAGDGVDSEGVPAVDVQRVTGHCLRHVVGRTVEVEAKGVGQREGQQVQRQVHGATLVVDGGRLGPDARGPPGERVMELMTLMTSAV